MIIKFVDVEDIHTFVLLCKYFHLCSAERLEEHKKMKKYFSIDLDLTNDGCIKVIEKLVQCPRAAFYVRHICIEGDTNVFRSLPHHVSYIKNLLYHCCFKSSMKTWISALMLQSPHLIWHLEL